MKRSLFSRWLGLLPLFAMAWFSTRAGAATSVTYEGKDGPGKGKHIVMVSGDEEYRSEEGLPQLAKILSQRHGFKCTVLFSLDPDGTINPNNSKSVSDSAAMDTADLIILQLRWRDWPDADMEHFINAYKRGVPIIGLRTATHAFQFKQGTHKDYNTFGKRVLGEQWVNHWGKHQVEGDRGIIEAGAKGLPIMNGVENLFCTTDVYEAYPPADATLLVRGQVVQSLSPDAPASERKAKRATDKQEQGVNDPMMATAWTRIYKNEAGKENRVLCTTMGAATDLLNEGVRRLIVNGVYWGFGMEIPAKADVALVGDYKPSKYGFNGFKKGLKPDDFADATK